MPSPSRFPPQYQRSDAAIVHQTWPRRIEGPIREPLNEKIRPIVVKDMVKYLLRLETRLLLLGKFRLTDSGVVPSSIYLILHRALILIAHTAEVSLDL